MLTLINTICILAIVAVIAHVYLMDAKKRESHFKQIHGFSQKDFKELLKMMRDSNYPANKQVQDFEKYKYN